jgi:hypothetical protein
MLGLTSLNRVENGPLTICHLPSKRLKSTTPLPACALAALILLLTGCAAGRPGSANTINELHLFGLPTTLHLDHKPEPDGFAVRIYASNHLHAKGIPIKQGSLEILMFDGVVNAQTNSLPKPRRVWNFDPDQLKAYSGTSKIGLGYRFALRWDNAAPTRDRITILARYQSPRGPISSAPSAISLK